MAEQKVTKWKFVTPKERTLATVSTVVGVSALTVGLSFVFSPLALGIAGGVVLTRQVRQAQSSRRKRTLKNLVSSGKLSAVPAKEPVSLIATEISGQLGWKEPPKIYTVKNSRETGFFAALPGTNAILTNRASLNKMAEPEELRFAIAHEMSHLKTDGRSGIGRKIILQTIKGLALAGLVTLVGAAVGVSAPFLVGSIGVLGFAALAAIPVTNLAMKFNSRIRERRADRNALYITRDLNNGIKALDHVYPKAKRRLSLRKEVFQSHPSYGRRIKSMSKVFNKKVVNAPELPAPVKAVVENPKQPDGTYVFKLNNGTTLRF